MKSIIQEAIKKYPVKYKVSNKGRTVTAYFDAKDIWNDNLYFVSNVIKQRGAIRITNEVSTNKDIIELGKLSGTATYNPKDKYIKGMTYKIARKRLFVKFYKHMIKIVTQYRNDCRAAASNADTVVNNLKKSLDGSKKNVSYIIRQIYRNNGK